MSTVLSVPDEDDDSAVYEVRACIELLSAQRGEPFELFAHRVWAAALCLGADTTDVEFAAFLERGQELDESTVSRVRHALWELEQFGLSEA